MRKLFLMRHGKAENLSKNDANRSLAESGKEATQKIAGFITEFKRPPSFILSSPARRALQTSEIIQAEMDKKGMIPLLDADDRLYNFDMHGDDLIHILASLGDEFLSMMIVGHNPSMEQILWDLLKKRIVASTATLAVLKFDIENWQELKNHSVDDLKVQLFSLKSPKEL